MEKLIQELMEGDAYVRLEAAEALGKLKNNRAVEPLIEALHDDDEDVRAEAAKALGEIGSAKAIASLIEALEDNHSEVRESAEEALGRIRDATQREEVIEPPKDSDEDFQLEPMEGHGKAGLPRVEEPIVDSKMKPVDVRESQLDSPEKTQSSMPVETPINELRGKPSETLVQTALLRSDII